MSDDVRINPGELRRIAGLILGDQQADFVPNFKALSEQLLADPARAVVVEGEGVPGYIYGPSDIGKYHDELRTELLVMFDSLGKGMIAVSNVLASAAEDFGSTDSDAQDRLADTRQYFNPALDMTSSGYHAPDPGF